MISLLLSIWSPLLWAQDPEIATVPTKSVLASTDSLSTKETYKDIISKSHNLSLQKDRLQAIKIIQRVANKEKGQARAELLNALKEVAEIFYSEKGQQGYELGRSLEESSPQMAVEKLQEVLLIETNNIAILKAIARNQLVLSLCDKSLETAELALQLNPFDEDIILFRQQSLFCLGKIEYTKLVQDLAEIKRAPVKYFADFLKARALYHEGKLPAAEAQLDKTLATDSSFPEAYFYMAQIKLKSGKSPFEFYQKYISRCSNLSGEKRRKYYMEPKLCSEKAKVEAEIEKLLPGKT